MSLILRLLFHSFQKLSNVKLLLRLRLYKERIFCCMCIHCTKKMIVCMYVQWYVGREELKNFANILSILTFYKICGYIFILKTSNFFRKLYGKAKNEQKFYSASVKLYKVSQVINWLFFFNNFKIIYLKEQQFDFPWPKLSCQKKLTSGKNSW